MYVSIAVLLLAFPFFPSADADITTASVSVGTERTDYTAVPTADSSYPLAVECTVSVIDPLQKDIVFMPRTEGVEWQYNVLGGVIVIPANPGQTTMGYTMTVYVPPNASAGKHVVYVTGLWRYADSSDWHGSQGTRIIVNVKPYYSIGVDVPVGVDSCSLGGTCTMDFTVINRGNARSSFRLDIRDSPLDPKLSLMSTGALEPGEEVALQVSVAFPDGVPPGDYWMDINITSDSNESSFRVLMFRGYIRDKVLYVALGLGPVLYIQPEASSFLVSRGSMSFRVWSFLGGATNVSLYARGGDAVFTPPSADIGQGGYSRYTMSLSNLSSPADYIVVGAVSDNAALVRERRIPVVYSSPRTAESSYPVATYTAVAAVGTMTLLGAALYANEKFRYALLLLVVPLYTRIDEEEVLNHFVRGRIYEYLKENPGVHYSQIKRELGLSNGELSYHLNVLEKKELVKSISDGRLKRFFVLETKIDRSVYRGRSLKTRILRLVSENPGITQDELSAMINDRKPRTVKYYIKELEREGLIKMVKDGKYRRCYLAEDIASTREPGGKEGTPIHDHIIY